MICWLPAVVSGVTSWPEPVVPVTAALEPAPAPACTTKIWNAGEALGAGVHWYAHPIFHVPAATVKALLVQLPWEVC